MNLRYWLGALVAAAVMAVFAGSAQAADLKCGLSNGKPATGAPIVIGGIVSITGPDNSASPALRPRLISTA